MLKCNNLFLANFVMFSRLFLSCYLGAKQRYQQFKHYFTSGAFGVFFYPLLMYPCVRYTDRLITRLFSLLAIFGALYYFFAEFVAVLFSESIFATYIQHTPMELLLPLNTQIEERVLTLSPLAHIMNSAYKLQSLLFCGIFLFCCTKITENKGRILSGLCALLFCFGGMLLTESHGGKWLEGGLHNSGFALTFIFGHLTMLLTGVFSFPTNRKFKWYSIIASIIGISALSYPFFVNDTFTPSVERLGIYLFLIWEMTLGFCILKSTQTTQHNINKSE